MIPYKPNSDHSLLWSCYFLFISLTLFVMSSLLRVTAIYRGLFTLTRQYLHRYKRTYRSNHVTTSRINGTIKCDFKQGEATSIDWPNQQPKTYYECNDWIIACKNVFLFHLIFSTFFVTFDASLARTSSAHQTYMRVNFVYLTPTSYTRHIPFSILPSFLNTPTFLSDLLIITIIFYALWH